MNHAIAMNTIEAFEQRFDKTPTGRLAMNAVTKAGIQSASASYDLQRRMRYGFSLELEAGKLTNQKSSGRCWMFASLNTMRVEVMKKLNLENFELSQNYPLFWDKLEKSNYFLESILDTLDEPLNGRLVSFLLAAPLGDGGQWDMFANIVEKYGVVPKEMMPETFHSSNTGVMNKYLTLKLREFACILREAHAAGQSREQLAAKKEDMLYTIYQMLCVCLGKPPREVMLEVRDKDNEFHRVGPMSPQDFFQEYVGFNLDDYVSLINAPTADKPFGRTYTVKYLGNVREGRPVRYLNLPIEDLKAAAIAQMQDGKLVWFGCDVGQRLDGEWGSMDLESFDLEPTLGTTFPMTKAQRLDYGESLMTHAMVFAGVNLDENGKPNRWKVENSWGEERGNKGWYIMSDDWFSEYTYQVLIEKKYLTAQQLAALEQEPIALEPWDPMGSLAVMK